MVASACAERNAICSLEMGGKNVIMVMDDADIDLAIEGAVWGAFGTSGQRCTARLARGRSQESLQEVFATSSSSGQRLCASAMERVPKPTWDR